jgi:hypothetical protein
MLPTKQWSDDPKKPSTGLKLKNDRLLNGAWFRKISIQDEMLKRMSYRMTVKPGVRCTGQIATQAPVNVRKVSCHDT